MTEGLFILTVIFVAYVVYVTVNDHKETSKPTIPKITPELPKATAAQPISEAIVKIKKPAPTKQIPIAKNTPKAKIQATVKKGLKDPITGEIATTYNNYRFTKRWIKDALVTEGLIEKVYKNTELDPVIEAIIKEALLKLESIDKYKP
ncbi:MAG: hypothetical protein NTV66_09820 [Methylococcales bacterium]|jgi:hypothetical protein|nr:hypothetical protein [Methylococcales bacterium]